jgi:LysM repeat protein
LAQLSHFLAETRSKSVQNALKSSSKSVSPTVKRFFREKLKKPFVHLLLLSSASWAMFAPLAATASFFSLGSILSQTATVAGATVSSFNSQTVPLLSPAVNIDPNPAVGGGDINLVEGQALLPQEGPEGTAADISDQPSATAISIYTVHSGDTIASIAKMFSVSANTIVWANDLSGPITVGQQLIILPISGVQYTVKSGDTLASIAQKYKADANEIAQFNNLAAGSTLAMGDTLIIPNAESTAAPVAKKVSKPASAGSGARAGSFEPFLGGSGPAIPGYFSWPLSGGVITQGLHGWNAVDIGAPKGTSIYAAAAGTVIIAKFNGGWNGGYGNYVVISHPNGTQTLYAHMSAVVSSVGSHVSTGQIVGRVGSTGESTGPHLHFEVRGAANPFAK